MTQLVYNAVRPSTEDISQNYVQLGKTLQDSFKTLSTALQNRDTAAKDRATKVLQDRMLKHTDSKAYSTALANGDLTKDIPTELITPEALTMLQKHRSDLLSNEVSAESILSTIANRNKTNAETQEIAPNAQSQRAVQAAQVNNYNTDAAYKQKQVNSYDADNQVERALRNAQANAANANASESRANINLRNKEYDYKIAEANKARASDAATAEFYLNAALNGGLTDVGNTLTNLQNNPNILPSAKTAIATEVTKNAGITPFNPIAPTVTDMFTIPNGHIFPMKELVAGKDITKEVTLDSFKGGEIGDVDPAMPKLAYAAQNVLGDSFNRFTAGNDDYHKGHKSFHNSGNALDFTLKDDSNDSYKKAHEKLQAAYKSAGLIEGRDYHLRDEKNNPSDRATKPHLHLELYDSGKAKLANTTDPVTSLLNQREQSRQAAYDNARSASEIASNVANELTTIKLPDGITPSPTTYATHISKMNTLSLGSGDIQDLAGVIKQVSKDNPKLTLAEAATVVANATEPSKWWNFVDNFRVDDKLDEKAKAYLKAKQGINVNAANRKDDEARTKAALEAAQKLNAEVRDLQVKANANVPNAHIELNNLLSKIQQQQQQQPTDTVSNPVATLLDQIAKLRK